MDFPRSSGRDDVLWLDRRHGCVYVYPHHSTACRLENSCRICQSSTETSIEISKVEVGASTYAHAVVSHSHRAWNVDLHLASVYHRAVYTVAIDGEHHKALFIASGCQPQIPPKRTTSRPGSSSSTHRKPAMPKISPRGRGERSGAREEGVRCRVWLSLIS